MTDSSEPSAQSADAGLIDEYLMLPDEEKLVTLLTPASTTDEALQYFADAKRTLAARRAALALQLSNDGLFSLLDNLEKKAGVSHWMIGNALSGYPPAQPALAELETRRDREGLVADHEGEPLVLKAKKLMKKRWKEGPVNAREWMVAIAGEKIDPTQGIIILKAWSGYVGAKAFLKEKETQSNSGLTDEDSPKRCRETEEVREFVGNFAIHLSPPKCIKIKLAETFVTRWPEDRLLANDAGKAHAVLRWHPFWEKYGPPWLARLIASKLKQSDAAKDTNAKRNRKYWSDELLLDLVEGFAKQYPTAQRNIQNARNFSLPGRDAEDAGEILGTLITYKDGPSDLAAKEIVGILSKADWRAPAETAFGSSAGTAKRTKTGRLRKPHKGIKAKEETILKCLNLLKSKK